jgi:Flp pilus assembly protein TadB
VKRADRPTLITDAERSQEQQLRSREIRYVLMMGLRAVCLILGGVLLSLHPPLVGLWVSLCVVGMVLLPWLAVLLANDRPPKPEHRLANRLHRAAPPAETPNAISDGARPEPKVIDIEP